MKTITFYSYKGGVGRSLILANIAARLADFGKKVCLLDFDLEAPGLQMKFETFEHPVNSGLVDYIHDYAVNGILHESLKNYIYPKLTVNDRITLIPAGNPDSSEYWKKLSSINWYNILYGNPDGISFFLDLKEKIKAQIQPDFLLIDSRTGISEMSGITLSLFADDVVVVAANNKENLTGVSRIIKALNKDENTLFNKAPRITFVLSRIPFPEKPEQKTSESLLIEKVKREFSSLSITDINIIHSDRDLEMNEQLKIHLDTDTGSNYISKDYLNLFEKLTQGYFNQFELEILNRQKQAQQLFIQSLNQRGLSNLQKIELIDKAIELSPDQHIFKHYKAFYLNHEGDYEGALETIRSLFASGYRNWNLYTLQALVYYEIEQFDNAIKSSEKAVELSLRNPESLIFLAQSYSRIKKYELATQLYLESIEKKPESFDAYNGLANVYRLMGNFELALKYVYKSLEINPSYNIAYATLAEINAATGNFQEFYLNLEKCFMLTDDHQMIALQKSLNKEDIYNQFIHENRFKELLEKYNVVLNLDSYRVQNL